MVEILLVTVQKYARDIPRVTRIFVRLSLPIRFSKIEFRARCDIKLLKRRPSECNRCKSLRSVSHSKNCDQNGNDYAFPPMYFLDRGAP